METALLRALDLFCGAGGVSVGLQRAGFEVTGVDIAPQRHYRGGTFVQADALTFPLEGFDFVWASPPCQAHSSLRHLQAGKVYPELIPATRARLEAAGIPWCIENVPGAPLGASGFLIMLCGTMFGLQTPDGRAEIRRHRLFETSFSIPLRPACQHGYRPESLSVCGTGMGVGNKGKEAEVKARRGVLSVVGGSPEVKLPGYKGDGTDTTRQVLVVTGHSYQGKDAHSRRRAISVTGNTPQTNNTVRNATRETFSIADARAAMGIDWMPMKCLSQAIPPAYSEWIGIQAIRFLDSQKPAA
jgi:DNA (cytosine-5)-methyltransferase 1